MAAGGAGAAAVSAAGDRVHQRGVGGCLAERCAAWVRQGLDETGYREGRNVMIEYHWLEGRHTMACRRCCRGRSVRRVAVIATPGSTVAGLAAKAATETIPIVFGVAEDPVKLGLVASLARPGGNATGVNFFSMKR